MERLIHALGIRHISINGARVLAEHYPDLKSVMQASPSELAEIADFGDIKSIHQFFQLDHEKINEDLAALGLNMQAVFANDGGRRVERTAIDWKTLVITGTLPSLKRKEAQDIVTAGRSKFSVPKDRFCVIYEKQIVN